MDGGHLDKAVSKWWPQQREREREKEVTALEADTHPQPEGLEGVCRVQTDAISSAPTAVGSLIG